MAQTTEQNSAREVERFYDSLSGVYDRMTGFEKRFIAERPFFKLLVDRHEIRTALDAGAGTGFHSLLLAELGVGVTAVDLSEEMLRSLRAHARSRGSTIETLRAGFGQLPEAWTERFDAVFCLGNSLPHLRDERGMSEALSHFRRVLRPGGVLFLQLLNYDRILLERERVQGIREEGGTIFVRFYDFGEELVRFNILQITRGEGGIKHRLEGVTLRPWRGGELSPLMERAGFASIESYGGLSMEPFAPATSRDLVLKAAASVSQGHP